MITGSPSMRLLEFGYEMKKPWFELIDQNLRLMYTMCPPNPIAEFWLDFYSLRPLSEEKSEHRRISRRPRQRHIRLAASR